jgi:small subunit ribosomal protein S16
VGSKKNPVWRVVVADQRSPRDGRIIEQIGHYDPKPDPSRIVIDRERLDHWLALGAEPTNTVRKLMRAPSTPAPVAKSEPSAADEGAVALAEPEGAEEIEVAEEEPDGSDQVAAESAPADPAEDAPQADADAPQADAPDESS